VPSCVVSRDRVPYRKDSGASACKISPPSGETVPLLPRALLHLVLGGSVANTASLRCPGVLLKVLAAQVGVSSLYLFSTLWALFSLRSLVHQVACNLAFVLWICHQQKWSLDCLRLSWGTLPRGKLGHLQQRAPLPLFYCLGIWGC
jgi:hypothetical protein